MDRYESTRHLMKAAAADQSRMLQQTICHHRLTNLSISVSWGYSVHVYETILPRSHLQMPLETFDPWSSTPRPRPRPLTYSRAAPRGLPPCSSGTANNGADFVSEIRVFSPTTKRKEMDRCECCDVIAVDDTTAELKFRECMINEVIA